MITWDANELSEWLLANPPERERSRWVRVCKRLASRRARRDLVRGRRVVNVLLDVCVADHARIHRAGTWTKRLEWPGPGNWVEVELPEKIESPHLKDRILENISYLPGLASLVEGGYLRFNRSRELCVEQWGGTVGDAHPFEAGWFGFSVFEGLPVVESLDGYPGTDRLDRVSTFHDRVEESGCSVFASLREEFSSECSRKGKKGENFEKDIWHVRTAEVFGQYCFLTLDFSLRQAFENKRKSVAVQLLQTRVLTPKELGESLGVDPVDPRVCELAIEDMVFSTLGTRQRV